MILLCYISKEGGTSIYCKTGLEACLSFQRACKILFNFKLKCLAKTRPYSHDYIHGNFCLKNDKQTIWMGIHNGLGIHTPSLPVLAERQKLLPCTESIMSAWLSRSAATCGCSCQTQPVVTWWEVPSHSGLKKEAQFALGLATPSSNYRKFNMKSSGISYISHSVSSCRKAAVHFAYVGKGKQVTLQKHCSLAQMWKQNAQLLRDGLFS